MYLPSLMADIAGVIAALGAAFAAFLSWKSAVAQNHKTEIREASASLIGAVHVLSQNSRDMSRDNMADRAELYQTSVIFELAAGPGLDQPRFNAAINWILKASGLRHDFVTNENGECPLGNHYNTLIDDLVRETTEAIRYFDQTKGKTDIAKDLSKRFGEVYREKYYHQDPKIKEALSVERNYFDTLLNN